MPPFIATPAESEVGIPTSLGYGRSQPMRNEFQRYPGHPARTDLKAVFPELSWDQIYKIAPRVVKGGSENGTVKVASQPAEPQPDTDRLYATMGELEFMNSKATSEESRDPQASAFGGALKAEWVSLIEKRKAFVTTTSRAPELTLFGTPKIAVWPISNIDSPPAGQVYRTAFDKLIAFCSTLKGQEAGNAVEFPYYFTRLDSLSPTVDINLPRNLELYQYLQRLTSEPFPGIGDLSFATKYGNHERDQILTEIFDYVRSTNIQDMQLEGARRFNNRAVVAPTSWTPPGSGKTSGFGRTITVRQVGYQLICTGDSATASSNRPPGAPSGGFDRENYTLSQKLQSNERRVQALLLLELFSPSAGFKMFDTSLRPYVHVSGLETVTVGNALSGDVNLGFPDASASAVQMPTDLSSYSGSFGSNGGAINYRWMYFKGSTTPYSLVPRAGLTGDANGFPYVSEPVTLKIDPANPTVTLKGGSLKIEVYFVDPVTNAKSTLSEVTVNLEEATLPAPRLHPTANFWTFHECGYAKIPAIKGRFPAAVLDSSKTSTNRLITEFDTVQTYFLPHGDYRQLFNPNQASFNLVAVPGGGSNNALRHFLSDAGNGGVPGQATNTSFAPNVAVTWADQAAPPILTGTDYATKLGSLNAPWTYGDWDTGSPIWVTDGPLINKPDEGNQNWGDITKNLNPYWVTYSVANTAGNVTDGLKYHAGNRQISSPVMFGSLPTGMIGGKPWQTLLFRPDPGAHPGANDPPDHRLLDLFWMPVVEPYAISEPFSTAGKVNMNYQIIPFTYIERSTAMHAILQTEKIVAIPESNWKNGIYRKDYSPDHPVEFSHSINIGETLTPFRTKFAQGEVFITPSEITELYLVPQLSGETYSTMPAYWNRHRLTGENIKERPYSHIYPRLTTKSNVFNVHYRVQVLRKPKGQDADAKVWNEESARILAEARGNTLIERYIDMNQANIPDYATDAGVNAEGLYRIRVLLNKEFSP
jgi:hypothetical protein